MTAPSTLHRAPSYETDEDRLHRLELLRHEAEEARERRLTAAGHLPDDSYAAFYAEMRAIPARDWETEPASASVSGRADWTCRLADAQKQALGEAVKAARLAKGWTQEQLGRAMGAPGGSGAKAAALNLESGMMPRSRARAVRALEALGMDVRVLDGGQV